MTSSETCPQNDIDVSDHLSQSGDTESSVLTKSSQESDDSTHETDDFDTALHEYGRSIFESAMDDFHDEDRSHENRILKNEQKVRALYSSASNDLKSHLAVFQDENRILEDKNSKLEVEISRLERSLQAQRALTDMADIAYSNVAVERSELEDSNAREVKKGQRLEAQLSAMQQDKKRKAERKAEMWERVEKRRAE